MEIKATSLTLVKKSKWQIIKKDLIANKYIYLMLVPVLLYYVIFHYVPMAGLSIAFQDYSFGRGILGSKWVGFKHFIDFFTTPSFYRIVKNTIMINFYEIIFGFPAPILLALLLNEVKNIFFKRAIQTLGYLPHFISLVVICGIISDFSSTYGMFNQIISAFGGEPSNLLMKKDLFRTIFVGSGIWQGVGWGSIIYLATLSSIDPNLYEAAVIDGAGRFKQMLHITLPSLVPVILVLFIMRLGTIMSQGHEKIILLYNPLTYETADVISSYVYRRGVQETDYSFGTAVGLFNSTINVIVLVTANFLSNKLTSHSLW